MKNLNFADNTKAYLSIFSQLHLHRVTFSLQLITRNYFINYKEIAVPSLALRDIQSVYESAEVSFLYHNGLA